MCSLSCGPLSNLFNLFNFLALVSCLAILPVAQAQPRPYIGFVYPAGGQQGATCQIRLGGQGFEDVSTVLVTGSGVTASVTENYRRLNNQELQLLSEQLRALRREVMSDSARASLTGSESAGMMSENSMMTASAATNEQTSAGSKAEARKLIDKLEKRTAEFVQTPASAALASLVMVEVTVAPDAQPGEREIRLVTPRGVSNPLPFYVGQVPEFSRKPMLTAIKQVLGKEADALRKRPPEEVEDRITLPCTVNGQIASGEINHYHFEARQGQRLVITTLGRHLVPFIADAVPGWFQPVLVLYDASGKEVAYDDDYRFKPDPTIFYEVPKDGEYVFAIHDSLYRGREDFVYRITVGELPFITSLFPLGGRTSVPAAPTSASANPAASNTSIPLTPALSQRERENPRQPVRETNAPQIHAGRAAVLPLPSGEGRGEGNSIAPDRAKSKSASAAPTPQVRGWNLEGAQLLPLPADTGPGIYSLAVNRKGFISNLVPFALGTLPEVLEHEPNNTPAQAQKVTLPVIINGRIDRPDDWDVFQFTGKSNDLLVAEVQARRLDSPLDSVIKLTDAAGNLLAFNDDHEDLASGLNTHLADSYFMTRLPADGLYYVHIGDTAQQGGEEYGYRLRLSAPQPDFDLRVVPSSLSLRAKSAAPLTVYAQRKDGFVGPIKLALKNPPDGFSAAPVTLSATQTVARLAIKTTLVATPQPVSLTVVGSAKIDGQELAHPAVPAEDRMQAFLWRHLVPAKDLQVLVFDPAYEPAPKRIPRPPPPSLAATNAPAPTNAIVAANASLGTNLTLRTNAIAGTNTLGGTNLAAVSSNSVPPKPRFTKQQVAYRLRQLKRLFEDGLLTDDFYNEKVAECQAAE